MFNWLLYPLALVVALGVLITVHEWGHFAMARRCGVQVLRFSIGFGMPLWRRTGRDGTEYVIAAIPLGGYVKMLDEGEGEVPPHLHERAFNRKPVAQRFAIVAAGPLVNLAFAVVAYWLLAVVGQAHMAPIVGEVRAGSPAALAGLHVEDEVLRIDGVAVRSWDDLSLRLLARVGDSGRIAFALREPSGAQHDVEVPVEAFLRGDEQHNPADAIGLAPYFPSVAVVVGAVEPDIAFPDGHRETSPAKAAGLVAGDRIVAADGHPLADWEAWVEVVRGAPGRVLALDVDRAGRVVRVTLRPLAVPAGESGKVIGIAGIRSSMKWPDSWPARYVREVSWGPVEAIPHALAETWDRARMTLVWIGRMVAGSMSLKSLGGPLTIAEGAGVTASLGPGVFLGFLALLSISVGVLNLLPIPVLDGGHLVFYVIEAVRGRPVPENVRTRFLQVGVAILMFVFAVAMYNDIQRYVARIFDHL